MNWLLQNLQVISRQAIAGFKLLPKVRFAAWRNLPKILPIKEKQILSALLIIALITGYFSWQFWLNKLTVVIPSNGGTYTEGIIGQPQFINPVLMSSDVDKSLVNLIFSGLYKYDSNGNIVPNIADGFPEISDDGKTYTVKLKSVKWHNDLPVTPGDVVFTIQTIQNEKYKSPRRSEWLSTTVEQTGDNTVTFSLKDASAPFLDNLTLPIISQGVWGKIPPEQFSTSLGQVEAIGNGPYKISEIKKSGSESISSIKLEAFKQQNIQRAYLDKITLSFYNDSNSLIKALHGKQITGLGFNNFADQINIEKSAKNLTIHEVPLPQYQALFINTERKSLGDKRVRQALSLAVDPQKILENVYSNHGRLISGPILPEQIANLPKTNITTNQNEAATKLDEAGWKLKTQGNLRSKNNTDLVLQLVTNDNDINVRASQLIASQLKQVGINVNISTLSTKELIETKIIPRDYDLLVFIQKLGPNPDLFAFWHSSQSKSPGLNLSNYNNQQVDKLINQARSETNKEIRDKYYIEILEIMKQDIPAIFLVQPVYSYAIDKNISGFGINTLLDEPSRFYNLPYWHINTKRVLK